MSITAQLCDAPHFASRRRLRNPTPFETQQELADLFPPHKRVPLDRAEQFQRTKDSIRLARWERREAERIQARRAVGVTAKAEWQAFNGHATQEQVDAWNSKYGKIFIIGSGALKPVTIIPFPAPSKPPAPVRVALPLTFFNQVRNKPRLRYHIRGLLAEGSTSTIYGAPKTNKSTLAVDIGVHLAAQSEWRGKRIREARGVVYFAFERAAQVEKALEAYAVRDGLENIPFAVCGRLINMLDPGCVELVANTIADAEAHFGIPVGLAVFDTWNKGIAAGGGSEDKAEHQNVAAANLRRIIEAMPALHCMTIGHTGKDAAKGERGSNATMGDRDVGILLEAAGNVRSASVAYANDLADGALATFECEVVQIGKDDEGEAVTGFIVSKREIAAPMGKAGNAAKLTADDKLALQALGEALQAVGKLRPEMPGRSVTTDEWLDRCFKIGGVDPTAAKPSRDLHRRQVKLLANKLILVQDRLVRTINHATTDDVAISRAAPGGALPPIPKR